MSGTLLFWLAYAVIWVVVVGVAMASDRYLEYWDECGDCDTASLDSVLVLFITGLLALLWPLLLLAAVFITLVWLIRLVVRSFK